MSILNTAKAALAAVSGELTGLREQQKAKLARLSEIDSQVQALRESPINLEDFKGYVAKFIESQGASFASRLNLREWYRPKNRDHHDASRVATPWRSFEDEDGNYRETAIPLPDHSSLGSTNTLGFLCYFVPERVTEKLCDQLQREAGQRWGNADVVPVAQRRSLIAELEQEREAVEDELQSVTQSIAEITGALNPK